MLPADLQLPFGHLVLEKTIPFTAGKDRWVVEQVHVRYEYTKIHPNWDSMDRYAVFRKNGRFAGVADIWQRPFVEIHRLHFGQPWPVISVRGMFGLGANWDTVFVTVRHGKLVEMGRPPAMNSRGPFYGTTARTFGSSITTTGTWTWTIASTFAECL